MDHLIHPAKLHQQRQSELAPTVIDVRGAAEYAAGHIPDALHIPADDLPARLAEIPRDRPVVTY
jgi:rhodanese-related sulfurtransferase